MVYFYGTANLETIQMPRSFILRFVRRFGLFFFLHGEKERRGPILRFMTYCVKRATPDKQVGALM